MVQCCVAKGCKNIHDKRIDVHFHSFPFSRPEILKLWLTAMRREKWTPTRASKLCSEHFKETDYQDRPFALNKLLKLDAVPSIFMIPCCMVAVCMKNADEARQMGLNLTFFTFPKEGTLRKEWVSKCHRKDNFDSQNTHICSLHFKDEDYEDGTQATIMGTRPEKLKRTAIPSLHLLPEEGEVVSFWKKLATGGRIMDIDNKDVHGCISIKEEETLSTINDEPDSEYRDASVLKHENYFMGHEAEDERSSYDGSNTTVTGCCDVLQRSAITNQCASGVANRSPDYHEAQQPVNLLYGKGNIHRTIEDAFPTWRRKISSKLTSVTDTCAEEEISPISADLIKKEVKNYQDIVEYDGSFMETDFLIKREEIDIKCEEVTENESYMQSELSDTSHEGGYKRPTPLSAIKAEISIGVHACDKCSYQTAFQNKLTDHMLKSHFAFTYKCNICLFKTKHKPSLQDHIDTHISLLDRVMCDLCSYQAKNKHCLISRTTINHGNPSDVKIHQCKLCPYKGITKIYLGKHIARKHKKIRPGKNI